LQKYLMHLCTKNNNERREKREERKEKEIYSSLSLIFGVPLEVS